MTFRSSNDDLPPPWPPFIPPFDPLGSQPPYVPPESDPPEGSSTDDETDEFGFGIVENEVHVHDFHAPCMHLLGIDHELLTYRHQGRDYRLTDAHGHVVHDIIA